MNISQLSGNLNLNKLSLEQNAQTQAPTKSFEDILRNAVGEVNKTQVEAYNAMEGIATGKVANLQEAVQKIEQADLSLKLGLEVKNKALAAYKEVMRMQI